MKLNIGDLTLRNYYVFIIAVITVVITSCHVANLYDTDTKWKNTAIFKNFVSPWNEKPFGKTSFQYQNDTTWFYFLFKVVDDDIQLSNTSLTDEQNVLQSDRVELFFAKDSLMQPYYTFELDAAGRLFDARCLINPEDKMNPKQIDANWHINENDLQFTTTKTKKGYQIEGKIAISFLQNKQLIENQKLWCGIQRADFSK